MRAALLAATLTLMATPVLAKWGDWPAPSDVALERMVRSAYSAAAAYARANGNYFARDGEYEALAVAIAAGLAKDGYAMIGAPDEPAPDLAAARQCIAGEGTELRFAITLFGDGITLAAVTDSRVFSYQYDPHEDAAIIVTPAQDCVRK